VSLAREEMDEMGLGERNVRPLATQAKRYPAWRVDADDARKLDLRLAALRY